MLIPSIDLQGGAVVQLVQGERLAIRDDDVFAWVERFKPYAAVQVIDLDAAKGDGDIDRAREVLAAGAGQVIVGSSLFREGRPDLEFAARLCEALGRERIIGSVDSRGGRVVIHGWKTEVPLTPVYAVRALEPFCGEFLYTHVDREGLMRGTDMAAVRAVAAATARKVTAAGGITTQAEVDELDALGIDAVVGMAIYTRTLSLPPPSKRA